MKKWVRATHVVSVVLMVFLSIILVGNLTAQTPIPFRHKFPYVLPAKTTSIASPQDTLTLVGQWGCGQCLAVVMTGNYALIGNGSLLQVLDVSNPVAPQIIGQVDVGSYIFGMVISGDYAYMVPGFSVIDISNMAHPHVISNLSIPSSSAIAVSGNYAYVGDLFSEIYTINISDPKQPYIVNGYPMMRTRGSFINTIVVVDTLLYASTGDGTTADIFDISDTLAPIRNSTGYGYLGTFTIQGHYLYFVGSGGYNQLWMYDISQPLNPRYINGAYLHSSPNTISIRDTLVYVCEGGSGFEIFDVADTSNIQTVARMPYFFDFPSQFEIGPTSISLGSKIACVASNNGFWIVDISKLPCLTTDYFLGTGSGDVVDIVTDSSNHAFVGEYYGGLKILDFSNHSSPQLVGQYNPTNEAVRDVAVWNTKVYLLCDSDLEIIDVSNLSVPKVVGKVAFGDTLNDNNGFGVNGCLAIYDSTVYVARNSRKLFAVDISNPSLPTIKDVKETNGVPVNISRSGVRLYIANGDSLIQTFDVSNPQILNKVGNVNVKAIGGLYVSGQDLFALTDSGFSRFKLMDSLQCVYIGSCSMPIPIDYGSEIRVDKSFVYICYNEYFNIIDISNPTIPNLVYSYRDYYFCSAFAQVGNLTILGRESNSFLFLENNLTTRVGSGPIMPRSLTLYQNYPNPFNPKTRVKYQIPTLGIVVLKVYDILGREVTKLVDNKEEAGIHFVEFDATNLSSGVYFYRLTFNGQTWIKKMMVIK